MSFTPTIETAQVHGGTYAAQLGSNIPGSVQNGDCWIYQDVQIPDTGFHLYPFNFSYWLSHVGDASDSYFQAYFLDLTLPPTDPDFFQFLVKDNFDGEFWQDQNFDLSDWRGRLIRFVFLAHGVGSGSNIFAYLDDVSLNLSGVEHVQNGGFESGDFTHWKIGYPTVPAPFQALPTTLAFFGGSNGSLEPGSQNVDVTGNSDSFTVITDQPWLSAVPTSGVTDTTVAISCSTAGLPAGAYTGTVTLTVDSDTVRTVAVTLEVYESGSPWGCGASSLYNQPWDGSGNLLASQNDTGGGFGNFAACFDNFTPSRDTTLTEVTWIGGYFNPALRGPITRWKVLFYPDNLGQPGPTPLATFIITGTASEIFIGSGLDDASEVIPIFSYKATVSFPVTSGIKYWLSVVPDLVFPPQWGWAFGTGGDGVSYQNLFGTRSPLTTDFAFGICAAAPPNPQTYKAGTFTASAVEHKSDASPDNLEVTGFLDSDLITEHDIRAGLYDNAQVELRVINWKDPTQGALRLLKGTTGTIGMVNGQFQAELRGQTQKLTTILGSTYGPLCRAELFGGGDEGIDPTNHWKCRLNRSDYAQSGSVGSSPDAITIVPPANSLRRRSPHFADAPAPSGWFNDGVIIFTSGALNGYKREVQSWDGTTLILFPGEPLPQAPAPGDTFEIEPGCDHIRSGDCKNKFFNVINFAGEPDIPGLSLLLQSPYAHGS